MVARTSREVLRWYESLYLTYPIVVPKWDLSNGYTYAEILHVYYPDDINMLNFVNGRSLNSRLLNWALIKKFLKKKNLSISNDFIDATLHGKDGGAEELLEQTYELLTNKKAYSDATYERDNHFTDHPYEQSLNYYQRSHISKLIKNNLKISELITDPSYAHQEKKIDMIRDQLKIDRENIRIDNPERFDLKRTITERCLRKPLQSNANAQDWYAKTFSARSRSATAKSNKTNSMTPQSRQMSANISKQNSRLQSYNKKGIIHPNEENTLYKEIILKQHSIPLSDLIQKSESENL
ncbi:unnamed protein product [Adineta steineri]|uniref:CH-like domain-containing protein n=1 Tax=Adineta steineri TaxID=433720 RepID=A0A813Z9R3_9BILA|nr:unnamed protein product [Adineta steineri]CAF3637001.1 unnamed protein product [Adineta steineri]